MSGKLFLIIGPSGVGKGTTIDGLKRDHPEYVFPPSCTTRKIRPEEKEGDVYNFISKEEFEKDIKNDNFLEWAIVHKDNYYGTQKKPILEYIKKGKVVIREVDIQGFLSIRKILTDKELVSIFIKPPSIEELIERIKNRAPISNEELEKRLESMKRELANADLCDYYVVSRDGEIKRMVREVVEIIKKEMKG